MEKYKEYIDIGIEYIYSGKYQAALENIDKSIELNNNWEISYFYRAVAHQALGNLDEAMLDYSKAIKINPKMTDAYYNKAYISLSRKDIEKPDVEKAIKDLEKAIELDPKFVDALYAMAAAQKKIGDYHKALEYIELLLQVEPQAVNAKALKKLILNKYII